MWAALVRHVREAFTRILAATAAATLAYGMARLLLGQPTPIFAAIAAIVCLAPGIPSHFRQSINILLGVTTGIVVGEFIFMIPSNLEEVRIAVAVFVAMFLASLFGLPAVVPIQAGASALLVIVMGPQYAGLSRFLDVIVGVGVGLLFAVVFFRARLSFRE